VLFVFALLPRVNSLEPLWKITTYCSANQFLQHWAAFYLTLWVPSNVIYCSGDTKKELAWSAGIMLNILQLLERDFRPGCQDGRSQNSQYAILLGPREGTGKHKHRKLEISTLHFRCCSCSASMFIFWVTSWVAAHVKAAFDALVNVAVFYSSWHKMFDVLRCCVTSWSANSGLSRAIVSIHSKCSVDLLFCSWFNISGLWIAPGQIPGDEANRQPHSSAGGRVTGYEYGTPQAGPLLGPPYKAPYKAPINSAAKC